MTDLCLHGANILYLASFLNRDMFWLRILTCVGLVLGIIFFSTCDSPMYGPTAWHVVFLMINFYQIYQLILERRETDLPQHRELVGAVALEDLSRDELTNLLAREIHGNNDKRRDLKSNCDPSLNEEEKVLKQMVLNRLSRREILNLLTRRMWRTIRRRFKSRRNAARTQSQEITKSDTGNKSANIDISA